MSNERAYLEDREGFRFDFDGSRTGPEAFYQERRYDNIIAHFKAVPRRCDDLILDVGCGPGVLWRGYAPRHTISMPRSGSLIGIDLSLSGLETFSGIGVAAQARVDALPFLDGTFQVAVCADVIEHLHSPCAMLGELRRVLKPDGHLLISTPNAHGIYEHKAIFNLGGKPTAAALKDLLAARWLRGVPSPSFPQHVKLYSYAGLRKLVEQCGFGFVTGSLAGFALPGLGVAARRTRLYERRGGLRLLVALERIAPAVCWNMVMLFRAR